MNTAPKNHPSKLAAILGWNRTSYALMSGFLAIILLIIVVWYPLVEDYFAQINPEIPIWRQLDYLLIGIFLVMSLLIMAKPDLKTDALIVVIGLAGGLVIEGWGTQTLLWTYYTNERPPLWIIPAWPIASLSINRLARGLEHWLPALPVRAEKAIYLLIFGSFYGIMLLFVRPTPDKSLTILALIACALLILSPGSRRGALFNFIAGAGLGYFLEIWGTTRLCWTYYTQQTPPLFAVLAHGLAAVAFWRVGELWYQLSAQWLASRKKDSPSHSTREYPPV